MKRRMLMTAGVCVPLVLSLGCAAAGQGVGNLGMQMPAVRTLPSKNILMIVGNENRVVLPGTSIADVFVKNRLELDMGHAVTRMADTTSAAAMLSAANSADLVIIAESVTSMSIGTKISSTPTPIFSYEAFLQDELGLVDPEGETVDPGTPDEGAFGAIQGQTHINIVDSAHPLAAGLDGLVQVYRFPREMNFGRDVAPEAEVVATLPDYPSGALIYVLRKGAATFSGEPSPGLRVQYFTENDNETGTVNLMTNLGLQLFDAAVNYALVTDVAP